MTQRRTGTPRRKASDGLAARALLPTHQCAERRQQNAQGRSHEERVKDDAIEYHPHQQLQYVIVAERRFAMRIVRLARSMCEVLTCAGSGLSAPCVSHWKDDGLASSEPQISVVRRRLRRHEFPPAVPSRDTEPTEDECGPAPVEPVQGRPQTLRLPNVDAG